MSERGSSSKQEYEGLSRSPEYLNFRANVPQNKLSVGADNWTYYELGPKNLPALVCIPGTSSTADVFFYQLMSLGNKGYHIIACHYPAYWTHSDWVRGFHGFTQALKLKRFHIYGASLGGYLGLHYIAAHPECVISLIMSNGFSDTTPFHQSSKCLKMFGYLPEFYLKKYVLDSFPKETNYPLVVDFVVENFEKLNRSEIGSRLSLNCLPNTIRDIGKIDQSKLTFADSHDEVILPEVMRARLYEAFPNARYALMKTGGDFPYLAVPDEVNLHLELHVRHHGTLPDQDTNPPKSTDNPDEESKSSTSNSSDIRSTATSPSTQFLSLTTQQEVAAKLAAAENKKRAAGKTGASSSSSSSASSKEDGLQQGGSSKTRQERISTEDRESEEERESRRRLMSEVLAAEEAARNESIRQQMEQKKAQQTLLKQKQEAILSDLVDSEARSTNNSHLF